MRAIFRDWYIVIIAIVLVLGGTVFAARFGEPQTAAEQTTASMELPPQLAPDSADTGQPATADAHNHVTANAPPAGGDRSQPATAEPQGRASVAQETANPDPAAQDSSSAPPTPPLPAAAQAPAPEQQPAAPASPAASAPAQTAAPAPHASHDADAAARDLNAGRQSFRKCQACHSLEPGKNLIGPSLAGVVGKSAAEAEGFNYSPAMKESGVTWTADNLGSFLEAPQKFIPKNKMAFPGLKTASERDNLIAFLASSLEQASGGVAAASPSASAQSAQPQLPLSAARPTPQAAQQPDTGAAASRPGAVAYIPDVRYTVRSGIADGRMVFIGVGGAIEGQANPILSAAEGQIVQVTLLNGEGAEHDIVFPDENAASPRIVGRGASTILVFRATKAGDFVYYCSVAGHRAAGMEGQFIVTPRPPEDVTVEADIAQLPTEVPAPIGDRDPQTIRADLVAVELEARLDDGTTYGFWTFNGRVPGPMLRARVGDTLDVHVTNSEDSAFIHSVDFHAATGPGGGAASTQVDPGHTKSFKFKALVPGLYVYHCATPMVAHHITNGMYGMILNEPEGGLPSVDHEFYVMQGEIYTQESFGQHGRQDFSVEKLLNEQPEYFVFNGSVGALSKLHPLKAKVGETVRIFFGVGGPNFTSSFHVIGEIFDRVYSFADLQSPPLRGVQTITVPPGGATIVEFKVDVPGNYILVDHALSRAERGLTGILQVEGAPNPEIFDGKIEEGSGH